MTTSRICLAATLVGLIRKTLTRRNAAIALGAVAKLTHWMGLGIRRQLATPSASLE